jgi:hypothetical protein
MMNHPARYLRREAEAYKRGGESNGRYFLVVPN